MDDKLLSQIERPSRYLGNELNAVKKDLSQVEVTVALTYPDLYEIGMSNTGLHILYYMLNEDPTVAAERSYLPADDAEALLRERGTPLTTLENQIPLCDVDILGIQIPHELAYANIAKLIRLAHIPLWTKDRADTDPVILGGGPGAFAPEPVAPFYDAILLGDGETGFPEVIACVRAARAEKLPRPELHRRLAAITGVYVPSLYDVTYNDDDTIAAVTPNDPAAPAMVYKSLLDDLESAYYPEQAIVPYAETVHSRLGVEVMRGCTVGCRFCQAGMIYRPLRERSPKRIVDLAKCGLNSTGFTDLSLLSLDTGDYTLIDPLTKELLDETAEKRVALSLPSLRAGSLTDDVIRDIRRVRRTSFTIAPEAGTQRLRDVINKNISDEEIFETVERVAKNGWSALKLYFMVGFPTETDEDLDGLADLVLRCRELGRKHAGKRFNVTASLGTLVPKPHTPFQWDEQITREESRRRCMHISSILRPKGVGCKYHEPLHSWMEGVFSRGDRRLAPVIADAEARGAGFESWNERLDVELWNGVFAEHGIDPFVMGRRRDYDEVLPWDHLSARVTKKYLLNDRKKVDRMASPTTFDCRDDLCSGCAVCFEGDTRNRLAKYHTDAFGDGRRLPIALTSRVAMGHGVMQQLEKSLADKPRDQAAKAGADAVQAKLRRRRPKKPGKRRWAVTPGSPGQEGPADAFLDNVDDQQRRAAEPEPDAREPIPLPHAPGSAEASQAAEEQPPALHYCVTYERVGRLRFLAHRELMRTIYRALQRTTLPLRFTRGFHPKPKLCFGPPLPTGAESLEEELDLFLEEPIEPEALVAELRRVLPTEQGLRPLRAWLVPHNRSAQAGRAGSRWRFDLALAGLTEEDGRRAIAGWEARESWPYDVPRHEREARSVDLKALLRRLEVVDGALEFDLLTPDEGSAKPYQVVSVLTGVDPEVCRAGRFLMIEALRRCDEAAVSVA